MDRDKLICKEYTSDDSRLQVLFDKNYELLVCPSCLETSKNPKDNLWLLRCFLPVKKLSSLKQEISRRGMKSSSL